MSQLRIANGAGFLGDSLDAPRQLVEAAEIDYLTLEYLAELTMSILARAREKDSTAGYARDFIDVVQSLLPALSDQPQLRLVTNAGGVNPRECTKRVGQVLAAAGFPSTLLGVVTGDDLLPRMDELRGAGESFAHSETQLELDTLPGPLVSAHAYLGAEAIVAALARQARFVITGRVADASLTVGPAVHEYGWAWDDWNRLARATVVGHLIECGAQVTGGNSDYWQTHDLTDIGYPIAELDDDGSAIITKTPGSGGIVDRRTVVEQLVYEIGDPANYYTPDVVANFRDVTVDPVGADRVRVDGGTGVFRPARYKVSMAYRAGFMASGQLLVYGTDCQQKAQVCAQLILDRSERDGIKSASTCIETLGSGDGVPGTGRRSDSLTEVMLRITVQDPRREVVQRFVRQFAPLITNGPAGLAGYATGRATIRPVFAYWPTSVARHLVEPQVEVKTAVEWSQEN